jgi:uncharacterized membrane protein YdjX (TVP38/TMEM64 family)
VEHIFGNKNKKIKAILQAAPIVIMVTLPVLFLIVKGEFTLEVLLSYMPSNYFLALLFLSALYVLKSFSVFLPVSVLNSAVGCVFPIVPALLINTLGIALTITVSYWIGMFSGADYADKLIAKHPKIKEITENQRKNDWFVSYYLRVLPISCDVVSIYLGSLKMPFHKYFIAGMIGSVPGIVSATLFGVGVIDPDSRMWIPSLAIIVVLSVISYVIYKYIPVKSARKYNDSGGGRTHTEHKRRGK